MTHYTYLIVGGGMTAAAAVEGIRERDPDRRIGLIGLDPHPPYNRPPLSKGLWKGDDPDSIWRRTEQSGVDLHLGRRVTTLDAAGKQVTDDRGTAHGYDKLLLATGGAPRRLSGAPDDVIYFRTLDDYRHARELADGGARFAVLGGGFIGSEMAAALRTKDCDVTMIVPERGIGGRVFPANLASFLADYYREKGVTVRTLDTVEGIAPRGTTLVVDAKQAGAIEVDAVVAGLGIVPNVDLARQTGLTVENGIVVDDRLRTSEPDIYAAGDVARFFNSALETQLRVEHEDNANTMGKAAGRNMAGADEPYDHLPSFYSDLFDLGYEAVGEVDGRHETVADWKQEFREGVVYYLDDSRVRGVLLWNTWGQVDAARELIAEPGPFSAKQLRGRLPVD